MTTRVFVKPEVLRWAGERSALGADVLQRRFPKYDEWETGVTMPTLKQLENFAKVTHTPIGYLFLAKPPKLSVPIPDYRTVNNELIDTPSPDLLDTIYLCQQRQEWYRDYARSIGEVPLDFIGSATIRSAVIATASVIRSALHFNLDERRRTRTWAEALRRFIEQAEYLGVMVMVSGVVGSNNRRKLDPAEFRGFALSDDHAPLVFINGTDTKSAQMFTLAHELAHLWLGQSALSDTTPILSASHQVESWCNQIAGELLVPLAAFNSEYNRNAPLDDEKSRLARVFKVSTLVILRRMHDAGGLTHDELWQAYDAELAYLRSIIRPDRGGDYYLTTAARVSRRFARAVVTASMEGRSSFAEAFRLLGCRNMATFHELSQSLGVAV